MFSRVIRQSISVSEICWSVNRNINRLQTNTHLDLRLVLSIKRYLNTSSSPIFSKQNPQEKVNGTNEIKNKRQQDTKKSSENVNDENTGSTEKKRQAEDAKEDNQETDSKDEHKGKNQKASMFGKQLMVYNFEYYEKKDKETFVECLRMYQSNPGVKRDRVPFIYAALKYMEEFGVHKDLEVYKQLLNIFPKEKMIPTNVFQTMYIHYPREQYCATYVLEQMENNAVIPDSETELLLLSIFGRHGMPLEKYWKMMYWMPKFKNLNPWPTPKPLPDDPFELAKLAMTKISSIDIQSTITIFDTKDVEDSIDKTWIVSAMAPIQQELLKKHDKETPIYVEGPFRIYVSTSSVDYFTLRAKPIKDRKYPRLDDDGKRI